MTAFLGWTLPDTTVARPFTLYRDGEVSLVFGPEVATYGRDRLHHLTTLFRVLDPFLPALPGGHRAESGVVVSAPQLDRIRGLGQLSLALRQSDAPPSVSTPEGRSFLRQRLVAQTQERDMREAAQQTISCLTDNLPVTGRRSIPVQRGMDMHLLIRRSDERALKSALVARARSLDMAARAVTLTVSGLWPVLHFADVCAATDV